MESSSPLKSLKKQPYSFVLPIFFCSENFLEVRIFFEQLNFERVVERVSYKVINEVQYLVSAIIQLEPLKFAELVGSEVGKISLCSSLCLYVCLFFFFIIY